ncbi:uncharacterized protein LOC122382618 [Amphibalanus amphitrite]|uniref:uncharacterized protein LOC122382618 n=1 Tax=Amphibalanus amphitrite TaxID=1232801 RepID=UPI001C90F300|nr:uncharacterized protein LOC122382618 [Amphibalanus amphitrite]
MTRRWQPGGTGPVALLLLVALFWTEAEGACLQDDITADGFRSLLASGGNYDPIKITLTRCKTICSDTGNGEAAVEDGMACLCGTGTQLTGLTTATSCPTTCTEDGAECGGPDGLVTGEAAPLRSGPVELTPVTSPVTAGGTAVTAAGTTPAEVVDFVVNPGDGSPPFLLAGTANAVRGTDFSASLDYVSPGTFTISVSSPWAGNSSQVVVESAPLLLELNCPPLVEPNQPYFCSATVGGSGLQLTATFSDDSIAMTVSPPEAPWLSVGHPPPRGRAQSPVQTSGGELEFTLRWPFSQRTQLMALHWHGAGAGDCQLTLMEGSCSDASHVFCPSSGFCSPFCPLVTGTSNYSCDASEPTFCPLSGQCSMSDGTCAARAAPSLVASSVAPTTFTTAADAYGKLDLSSAGTWAEPGWFAKVTCSTGSVSWMATSAGTGDLGATSTDKRYMVELVGIPQTPMGIGHTCAAMSDITLTVTDGSTTTLTNTTACQIPVGTITVQVEQNSASVTPEASPAPGANFSGAFVIQSNVDVTFSVTISQGAPVQLNYTFDTASGVANFQESIQQSVTTADVFTHTVQFATSGTFTLKVTGTNLHSVPLQPAHSDLTVIVQHPVVAEWLPQLGADSQFLAVVTGTKIPAAVVLEMRLPSTAQLPTDAHMDIDFGDGFPITGLQLSDASINLADNTPTSAAVNGFFVAPVNHGFDSRGVYSVQITMRNKISEQVDTIEVVIENKIIGLEGLILQNLDDRRAEELLTGMGVDENQYRNDRNLTFGFNLLQGTMTKVTLFNDSDGGHIEMASYTFKDKDNPTAEQFVYHINTNQEIPLSFVGENTYETTDPVTVRVIIQDPITEISALKIAMSEQQSEDNFKLKNFTASWTSASTMQMCLAIHFGDNSPLATFGDEIMCAEKYPSAVNMPTALRNPMPLEFLYWNKGIYNVTINVFNPKDDETYELLVSVSDVACSNPTVSIVGASEEREDPPTYLKSQEIVIEAKAVLNCDASMTTKKRWEVIHIKTEESESAHIMHQLPHWDKADLVIPRNFLKPGLYLLQYTMTMQDEGLTDGDIFQTQSKAYLKVERTPLYAGIIKGAVSKIVRGWSQTIVLDALMYSVDPDDVLSKDFTFKWYCRRTGEEREGALGATTPPQSLVARQAAAAVPSPDLGGCFGEGPGQLDFDGGVLDLKTEILQPYRQQVTFVITAVVSKDVRSSMAEVQVEMLRGDPPLIEVQCADELLCSPSLGGVTVNPQHNLGLRGGCTDGECPMPLSWSWSLSTESADGTVTAVPNAEQYLPTPDAEEVRISKTLFSDFSGITKFQIGLQASDGVVGNDPGQVTYFVTVNLPPVVDGKECTCEPVGSSSFAVIDTFAIKCQTPLDPEGFPVEKFQFFTTVDGEAHVLAATKTPKLNTSLLLGTNQLHYVTEDQHGASGCFAG